MTGAGAPLYNQERMLTQQMPCWKRKSDWWKYEKVASLNEWVEEGQAKMVLAVNELSSKMDDAVVQPRSSSNYRALSD